jgi:uracil-DNA glycosylase
VSDEPLDPALLARFFRQRRELGSGSLIFDSLQGDEALELVKMARERSLASPERDGPARSVEGKLATFSAPGRTHRPQGLDPEASKLETGSTDSDRSGGEEFQGGQIFEPPTEYSALREAALTCTRCRLAQGRSQVVFSDGNPDARVMVVGEAPGANEDRTGLPFVGRAGKLLDLLLASVGLSREDSVYICNVLKCRPPGNRDPRQDEIKRCAPWLHRQIELVAPEVILAVGTFAGRLLSGKEMALGRLRGQVYSYRGTPLVVTYHPAALLRNSRWTRATWDDLQLLCQVLDGD